MCVHLYVLPLLCVTLTTTTVAAAWYVKWQVNRALRPEAMGGLVHLHQTGVKPDYPIQPSLAASGVLDELFDFNEQNNKRRVSEH